MTTGYLELRIADCKISGNFIDGLLQDGVIEKPNVIYRGTFDSNQYLNGDQCEEARETKFRRGKFEHGYLVEGICVWGQNSAEGRFEKGKLVEGTLILDEIKYEGEFRNNWLHYGTIYYPNEIHQGYFDHHKLRDGTICNLSGTFRAAIVFNGTDLKQCTAYCDPNKCISELNSLHLLLLCCQGIHCEEAFRFYTEYFMGKSAKIIVVSKIDVYRETRARIDTVLGYRQIRENIDKYLERNIPDIQPEESYANIFNYERYNSHS